MPSPVRSTGIGSLPGMDARDGAALVAGETEGMLHQVELPARGPGADLIGRTAGQIVASTGAFSVETTPDGWRVADAPNRVMRRAQSWWNEDADALESTAQEYRGDVKVQVCGPWTLAAMIELRSGERLVRDRGACRELAEALAVTAQDVVQNTRARIPGARRVYVQCDEPSLAAVAQGALRTASGYGRYAPVSSVDLEQALATVMSAIDAAGGTPGVHACAPRTPWDVIGKSGAAFVSFDALHAPIPDSQLGMFWESGVELFFGAISGTDQVGRWGAIEASAPVRNAGHRLGLDRFATVVVTPTCGLAGASPAWVRTAYAACKDAAILLQGEGSDEAS